MPFNLSKNLIINTLFSFIPISFIAGNLIINLNILLFILLSLIFYGKQIIKIKLLFLDKLILAFFSYLILVALYKNVYQEYFLASSEDLTVIIKTMLYLRFLILYFIIRYLVKFELLNFKIFFITCGLITAFLIFDLIFQYIFGFDIFGFEGKPRRMSGPFGEELIAGSYLQRFSIFSFFIIPIFFKKFETKNYKFYKAIFFGFLFFALIVAGNRIPLLFFTVMFFFLIIFEKEFKKYLIGFLFLVISIFTISYNVSEEFDDHYQVFQEEIFDIITSIGPNNNYDHLKKFKNDKKKERVKQRYTAQIGDKKIPLVNVYAKDLYSGYQTWKIQKFVGGGVKSYKKSCAKSAMINCGPHPHNYYLDILANVGLFGFLILLFIFLTLFYSSFIKRYFLKSKNHTNMLITPFIFLFFTEIFPIKTSGSFFTTGNSTYIFLILSILAALSTSKKFKLKQK